MHDSITHPCLNVKSNLSNYIPLFYLTTIAVRAWMSNYIPLFYLTTIAVRAWMSNYIPLFYLTTIAVRAWMSNYIPLMYVGVITYPYPNNDAGLLNLVNNRSPWCPYSALTSAIILTLTNQYQVRTCCILLIESMSSFSYVLFISVMTHCDILWQKFCSALHRSCWVISIQLSLVRF